MTVLNVEVSVRLECYVCGTAVYRRVESADKVLPAYTPEGWVMLRIEALEDGGSSDCFAPVCPSCRKSIREAQHEAVTKTRMRRR